MTEIQQCPSFGYGHFDSPIYPQYDSGLRVLQANFRTSPEEADVFFPRFLFRSVLPRLGEDGTTMPGKEKVWLIDYEPFWEEK